MTRSISLRLPLALSLALVVPALACSDDAPAETSETGANESSTSGDGDGDPTTTGDGDGDPTTTGDGDGDPATGDGDGDFPGERPDNFCPDGPSGECDEVPDAPLRVGSAALEMNPECFESWTDIAENGEFDEEDDFLDCGCDRMCPLDVGYPGPDEGENDGIFQPIWLGGFQNNRPASGIRGAELGLVGEGDGIWCRAIVLDQGNTRVALVSIDTVGYFYDEVEAIREMIADQEVDWLVVTATHNHEGPDTMGLWGEELASGGFDEDYRAQIRLTVAEAVTTAIAELEDVSTVTVGRGDASSANAGDPDKGIRNIHNDSRDPFIVDEAVDVLSFKNTDDETIVTLVNYANHPEALADENTLISSDYIHAVRKTIEEGSTWDQAPGVPGVGGDAIFISGALGGLMTPLGIATTSPDGDTWNTGEFEKADTIGQLVGEVALDALANGEVIANPQLQFANQPFFAEIINDSFKLAFGMGIFDRQVYEMDGKEWVRTEMGVLELGPVRMLTVPGELFPEIAVGGYDESQMFTTEVPFLDPNNPNPPNLDEAPEGPYLREVLGSQYTWIIGMGNDELGYIVPNYDFVLGFPPYLSEAEGDHYEETNSLGPQMEAIMFEQGGSLAEFIDWL